ncbi:MAG: Smr/MutS family protein [bacterium]
MGDKVCCTNTSVKGIVVRLLDSRHVVLLDEETDMEIDYPIHTLTLVEASHKELTNKAPTDKEEIKLTPQKNTSIDLHTEKLPKSYRTSTPLKGQLEYLDYKLALAISQGAKQLTIIHGKGNGILRNEVTKRLRKMPQIKSFKDPENVLALKGSKQVVVLK